MRITNRSAFSFSLIFFSAWLVTGCAGTPASSPNFGVLQLDAYEISTTVDVAHVISILEESTTHALDGAMAHTEGAMPASPPMTAPSPVIERKTRVLEGLGTVTIPSVRCPGSLATFHTLRAGQSGLHLVAACVSATQTGTVIHILEAAAEAADTTALMSRSLDHSDSSVVSLVGRLLVERLPAERMVGGRLVAGHGGEGVQATHPVMNDGLNLNGTEPLGKAIITVASAVPLVCFGPKTDHVSIRSNPGSSTIVGRLDTELIVDREGPVSKSDIHVETSGGVDGWVKRSDLRWEPCPIA